MGINEADEITEPDRTPFETPTWCAECGKHVEMVLTAEAAVVANTSPADILHKVENGLLHSLVATEEKRLFICLNSLMHINLNG